MPLFLRVSLLAGLLWWAAPPVALAQQPAPDGRRVPARLVNGDTIPTVQLHHLDVEGRYAPTRRRDVKRHDRLTNNVRKVYPYARIAADLLAEYEREMQLMADADRNLYLKLAEAELRAEFEAELRDLTMSQGRLLLKLVDRETGRTSYELVKDIRGGLQAFLWQGLAKLFGHDMRSTYDPLGEDNLTEVVVRRIENGELTARPRTPRTEKAEARLERRKARLYKKYGLGKDDVSLLPSAP
ncbi:MAG: DUF4294 domain-containing protein [Flavobacteriales bacterium]|jgi:hypothetical protein|nr:DUF4294 domain-containing protein [Flavobacteriales bacterium]